MLTISQAYKVLHRAQLVYADDEWWVLNDEHHFIVKAAALPAGLMCRTEPNLMDESFCKLVPKKLDPDLKSTWWVLHIDRALLLTPASYEPNGHRTGLYVPTPAQVSTLLARGTEATVEWKRLYNLRVTADGYDACVPMRNTLSGEMTALSERYCDLLAMCGTANNTWFSLGALREFQLRDAEGIRFACCMPVRSTAVLQYNITEIEQP